MSQHRHRGCGGRADERVMASGRRCFRCEECDAVIGPGGVTEVPDS